ncbi:hypothetical protein [Sulfurospirillum oryzae]|uniref:hypothetical protein n=1 Tax=Sulfurospirillum oryzae TaxID=2976535 RepID=UPI0021E949F4|nr:hypothetical protein [Sulfurospirillum oryzae]
MKRKFFLFLQKYLKDCVDFFLLQRIEKLERDNSILFDLLDNCDRKVDGALCGCRRVDLRLSILERKASQIEANET